MDKIAKIQVIVSKEGENFFLMSKKKEDGAESDGKLEFLGGHIKKKESTLEGLIRELKEEEVSCCLAEKAREGKLKSTEVEVAGALHYLFELKISQNEYDKLEAGAKESFGFQLIPEDELFSEKLRENLTSRTRKIIDVLKDRRF